jgi:hypothetical protein
LVRNFQEYTKVSDYNEMTLVKQSKRQDKRTAGAGYIDSDGSGDEGDDVIDENATGIQIEIQKENLAKLKNPELHSYSLLHIIGPGEIEEKCRFLFPSKLGTNLYVSYPYMVEMDVNCTKMYKLLGPDDRLLKAAKQFQIFNEPQMKIGTPNYFSPDLCHRIYVDPVTENIYLNDAILNKNLKVINVN